LYLDKEENDDGYNDPNYEAEHINDNDDQRSGEEEIMVSNMIKTLRKKKRPGLQGEGGQTRR